MQRVSARKRLYQSADDEHEHEVEDQLSDVTSSGSASGAFPAQPGAGASPQASSEH